MVVNEAKLPFSELKQQALIGYLITDEKFFRIVKDKIKPDWFLSTRNSTIFRTLLEYYEEYRTFPTVYAFKSYKKFDSLDMKEKVAVTSAIEICLSSSQQFRLDDIKKDFTEWYHSVIMMNALEKAGTYYNQQQIKPCYGILSEAVKEVNNSFFDTESHMAFSDFDSYMKDFETQVDNAITTGLSVLDQALLRGATFGGLLPGDTTVIMAPFNTGKTSFLISIACHNILRGKDVLFLTFEGNPDFIRLMFIANLLGVPVTDVLALRKTPEGKEKIKNVVKKLEAHLKYIPYNKANKMIVEDVIPIIIANQEQWKIEKGKGFDLLCADYPAVLSSQLAFRGTLQKRNIDQIIYNYFIQLGLEYKFHNLLPIQTNRDGSKVNKRFGGVNRILVPEDVQDSFGPVQQANNILTINRSPLAEKLGIATLGIGKTRTNTKGKAIIFRTRFDICQTHSNELGGIGYTGTKTIEEKYENLEKQFKNQFVPEGILRDVI